MTDITFITDFVCPFCIVAKEALKRALSELQMTASVTYIPFELTREPSPRVDTFHDERRRANYQVLVKPTEEMGLQLHFPPKVIPRPYSRLAFEGLLFAKAHGKGEAYNDRLYFSYFQDEEDIGSLAVLTRIAEELGMDGKAFRDALEKGTYRQEEEKLQKSVRENYSFRGVPAIYINGTKVELQHYSVTEMKEILLFAKSEEAGISCGEEGCH